VPTFTLACVPRSEHREISSELEATVHQPLFSHTPLRQEAAVAEHSATKPTTRRSRREETPLDVLRSFIGKCVKVGGSLLFRVGEVLVVS
jgi:hypothetical protein